MIEKMKKKTYSNSITDSKNKFSKKIINNISNRIRSLEKDINKIKNKETLKTLADKKQIEKNFSLSKEKNANTMTTSETKLYKYEVLISKVCLMEFPENFYKTDDKSAKMCYNKSTFLIETENVK